MALVSEDNRDVSSLIAHGLRERGLRVISCNDGLKSLQVLDRFWVDVVVADLHTPGPNGSRVLEYARVASPGAKLVLISGWVSADAERRAHAVGARILGKPLNLTELYEAVGA